MAKFTVLTNLLDRIEVSAGFKDDGTPKKIVTHTRGEENDFEGYDEDQLQRLVDLKAIAPTEDLKKGQPASQGPSAEEQDAAIRAFVSPEPPKEEEGEAETKDEAAAPPKAEGATKKAT